jgi:hypothetical protein
MDHSYLSSLGSAAWNGSSLGFSTQDETPATRSGYVWPSALAPYKSELELIFTTVSFAVLIPRIWAFLKGFPTSKRGKIIGYQPPEMLVFHILVSLGLTVRHLWRLATESTLPTSTGSDLILGLSVAASSWYLVRNTPFKSVIWRSSFQAVIPMYATAIFYAHTTGSPQWYATSMAFLFWFVTIRWAILGALKFDLYPGVPPAAAVHFVSVPVTLCWVNWTEAIPVYFVVLGLVTRFNRWVAKQVPHRCVDWTDFLPVFRARADRRNSRAPRSLPLGALVKLGFGEFQTRKPPVEQDQKDQSKKVESKSFYDWA